MCHSHTVLHQNCEVKDSGGSLLLDGERGSVDSNFSSAALTFEFELIFPLLPPYSQMWFSINTSLLLIALQPCCPASPLSAGVKT